MSRDLSMVCVSFGKAMALKSFHILCDRVPECQSLSLPVNLFNQGDNDEQDNRF